MRGIYARSFSTMTAIESLASLSLVRVTDESGLEKRWVRGVIFATNASRSLRLPTHNGGPLADNWGASRGATLEQGCVLIFTRGARLTYYHPKYQRKTNSFPFPYICGPRMKASNAGYPGSLIEQQKGCLKPQMTGHLAFILPIVYSPCALPFLPCA